MSNYQYYQYLKYIKQAKTPTAPINSSNTFITSTGPITFSDNNIGIMYSSPLSLKQNAITLDTSADIMLSGDLELNGENIIMKGIPLATTDTHNVTIDPITKRLAYQSYNGTVIEPNIIRNVSNIKGKTTESIVIQSGIGTSKLTLDNSGGVVLNGTNMTIGNTSSIINIGHPSSIVNILGTSTSVQSSTVTNQTIVLNKGGNTASAYGSGIAIEGNGENVGYIKSSSDGLSFDVKAPSDSKNYTMMLKDVDGNMAMTGNLSVNNNKLIVNSSSGDVTIGGTATIINNLNMNGILTCVSGCYIVGGVDIYGDSSLNNTKIKKTLDVSGNTTLKNTSITGALNVTGNTTTTGNSEINGVLNVKNNTLVDGGIFIKGNTTISGLTQLNDLSLNGSINSTSALDVVNIAGNTSLGSNLHVGGNFDVSGTSTLTGNAITKGEFRVTGKSMLNNEVFIGSNLYVSGINNNVSISGGTIIGGDTRMYGRADIYGIVNMKNKLYVDGNTKLYGSLDVSSNVHLSKQLDVSGATNIDGNTRIGGTLDVAGNTRCTNGVWISSDKRIKNNIIDIDDGNALSILRKIQPKTYEYIDKKTRGNNTVIGFIAQEIQEIIPNACTMSKDYIPNFYTTCRISHTDVSTIMLVSSVNDISWDDQGSFIDGSGNAQLVNQVFNIKFYDQNRNEIKCRTTSILDKQSFLIDVTGTRLETEPLQEEYFLYGQEVDNFHNLDKTAIYTVVTAAVQDMDRIQQAQQTQMQEQASQIQVDASNIAILQGQDITLQNEVASLKEHNTSLTSQLSTQDARIVALEASIQSLLSK